MKSEENGEKLLVLRKKYHNKCPADTSLNASANLSSASASDAAGVLQSPVDADMYYGDSNRSAPTTPARFSCANSADAGGGGVASPYLTPPPYKPPPPAPQQHMLQQHHQPVPSLTQAPPMVALPPAIVSHSTQDQYRECVDEFKWALNAFGNANTDSVNGSGTSETDNPPTSGGAPCASAVVVVGVVDGKPAAGLDIGAASGGQHSLRDKENDASTGGGPSRPPPPLEKQISVKEATKKFNQIACEEEVKFVASPPAKKPATQSGPNSQQQQQPAEKVRYVYSHL